MERLPIETDEVLVSRARAGDGDAFGSLIRRHQPAVAGVLLSMLHDVDCAEEIAQNAFVKAYRALDRFDGRASFKTWVTVIALNAARSELRWSKLRHWMPFFSTQDSEGVRWEEKLRERADDLGALEKKFEIERAMRLLSPREQEVVSLRLEGYALDEIAEALSISTGTVKSTLSSGARRMRQGLI